MKPSEIIIERHPWPPFIPDNAKLLVMGTFPPGNHRWAMDFYYPNPINDFWRIIGLIFFNDKDSLYNRELKTFDLERIKTLLTEKGIAMNDTAREVRRLKGNASDKYLEILKPVPLTQLLDEMPECEALATTGEKAAEVIARITSTAVPKTGQSVDWQYNGRPMRIYRMPSSSRAYPLALDKKAAFYREMFRQLGIV